MDRKEYMRRYRAKNKERINAYHAAYMRKRMDEDPAYKEHIRAQNRKSVRKYAARKMAETSEMQARLAALEAQVQEKA